MVPTWLVVAWSSDCFVLQNQHVPDIQTPRKMRCRQTLGRTKKAHHGTKNRGSKGSGTEKMSREAFRQRFMARFYDPAFRAEDASLARVEDIAWKAYSEGRKSPLTEKAGQGFADPDYDLSVEWRGASERIKAAQRKQADPSSTSRVLIVNASSRNDYSCPGEMSKSFRLSKLVKTTLESGKLSRGQSKRRNSGACVRIARR
jgi:hypothetical protein